MKIKTFTLGNLKNNTYLIENKNEAILIDCPDNIIKVVDYVKKNKLKLAACLLTHGHFDHIEGIDDLKSHFPSTKIVGSSLDKNWLLGDYNECFNLATKKTTLDIDINNKSNISFINLNIAIIETKGHTKGSVCYKIGDNLFSGDTLFYHSIGRYDLPGGDENEIFKSIKKLYKLKASTTVYPGHGRFTTIKNEIENNPFTKNI